MCNKDNLTPELKFLEMCLNSLFDFSYQSESRTIYADNNNLKIQYTKIGPKIEMKIVEVRLDEALPKFKITKIGDFDLYIENYKSLGVDIFSF